MVPDNTARGRERHVFSFAIFIGARDRRRGRDEYILFLVFDFYIRRYFYISAESYNKAQGIGACAAREPYIYFKSAKIYIFLQRRNFDIFYFIHNQKP